ncbi:hypothetical protein NA57DRAFT_56686 [Rhizodiscina lignyota]|uniref:Zn(2)-C6 fungal-type domain-containing protein n=1 Tax=Rhizodiscina lignyota TaxID=1504668 RepID=A0A9P4M969_9PEZI|nr:hypothetical protein NA57DRAFT_56686 [Rhizodiscina lignyota]
MPDGSRRYHTKTRNGCVMCKRRRVRCDLQAPICGHCKRRGDWCNYQHLTTCAAAETPHSEASEACKSETWRSQTEDSKEATPQLGDQSPGFNSHTQFTTHWTYHASQPLDTLPLTDAILQSPVFNSSNSQLMAHWTSHTSGTLAMIGTTTWIWRTEIPRYAQENPFLMHGVLSISALHIAHLQQPSYQSYSMAAQKQFDNALTLFRSSITTIDDKNCVAVLAFSLIVAIFQFKTSSSKSNGSEMDCLDEGIGAILALRSAWTLAFCLVAIPYAFHTGRWTMMFDRHSIFLKSSFRQEKTRTNRKRYVAMLSSNCGIGINWLLDVPRLGRI